MTKRRIPRKTKKARNKMWGHVWVKLVRLLTPNEQRRVRRAFFIAGSTPRKNAAHCAMGDTSTINRRIKADRRRAAFDKREDRMLRKPW